MRFQRQPNGVVEIGDDALRVMQHYRQLKLRTTEAGGVLLGRLISHTEHVIIDQATRPTSHDQRGRSFFKRAEESAQPIIDEAWITSNGTQIYLGEWHTHPEDDPTPSRHDLTNWQQIVQRAQFEQSFLLFAIVGRERTRVWEFGKESRAPVELHQISDRLAS